MRNAQPGDTVYQMVPSFGGMGAWLVGVVSKSGETVTITGGAAFVGAIPVGRKVRLTSAWEPSAIVDARLQEQEDKRAEQEAQKVKTAQRAKEAFDDVVRQRGWKPVEGPDDVQPGAIVYYVAPNTFGDTERPIVEAMQVRESLPGRIVNTDERTYPYSCLYQQAR
jgi:hypothetical protein